MNLLVAAWLLAAHANSAGTQVLCTAKNLGLAIAPDADVVAAGEPVTAKIAVEVMEPAARIGVSFVSKGALSSRTGNLDLAGPFKAGQTVSLPMEVSALGEGPGEVSVTAVTRDADGTQLRLRRAVLYGLAESGRVWLSGSSETDLRIRRANRERSEGRLSATAYAATLEGIVGTRVAADHTPRPAAAKTAADREIERVLGYSPNAQVMSVRPAATRTSATLTVKGHAEWTDSMGTKHGIPMATVEIYDEDLLSNNLIVTLSTDAVGDYTSTFTYDDGILGGLPDIFVKIYARSPVADIKPDTPAGTTYFLQSPTTNNVPDGTTLTVNFTAGNVADGETVFSVHHALVMIGAYAGTLAGVTPSQVDTRFPTTTQSTSCFVNPQLFILKLDRWDWDVVHHEYGHYFMAIQNFQANPGGMHGFGNNLATLYGKDAGIRLGWGEGWPTFFGTSGQNVMGAAALGVPNAGDTRYTDTEDSANNVDLETSTGKGEDNEVSVFSSLWDLFDSAKDGDDEVSMGDKALFNAVKGAGATTMGAAWEAVAATFDTKGKTKAGAVLGQANIAPVLLMPADNAMLKASDPPVEFKWKKNGGGTPNPLNDFRIRFYNADFSMIAFEKELGDTDTFTPTGPEWTQIFSKRKPVRWVVEGQNTSAPATPGGALAHYWSGARTIGGIDLALVIDDTGSMSEEIGGVVGAIQTFIDFVASVLPPGAEAPTIQVITFKDFVQDRITSNDLDAVRTVVGSLFASGGDDCPEFSDYAVQYASTTVSPGGTILLATDAAPQPGVDMGAVVSNLLAKGVSLNTILSGDCVGIDTRPASARDLPDHLLPSGPQTGGSVQAPPAARVPATPARAATLNLTVHASSGRGARGPASVTPAGAGKPGDDDPPQPPVIDPGQAPPDDHGDTPETATNIVMNAPPVRGVVGANGDIVDVFVFSLPASPAGRVSTVRVSEEDNYFFLTLGFYDSDGVTFLGNNFATTNLIPADTQITVTGTGFATLFLKVQRPAGAPGTAYRVSVLDDTLTQLTTAVGQFSAASKLTNGAFLVRDDVNLGATARYQAALFNLLVSTIQPTVLAANPDSLPQSTTLAVALQGRSTNFRSNSMVAFSGSGITVNSVTVHSATSLTALVTVDAGAALGLRDVAVATDLGGGTTEMATGTSVVEVVVPITIPAILSVEPATLSQGEMTHVIVRGVNTAWDGTSSLSLGAGVSVGPVTATSPTILEANVTVDADAEIGYRTAAVSTTSAPASLESQGRSVFVEIGGVVVPVLDSLSPTQGARGQTLDVALVGAATNFIDGITTGSFGAGITVNSVTVGDDTHATANISIDAAAAVGYRDVVLTTGTESAVLLNAFFVSDLAVGDVNGDGGINGLDIVYLINFIFAGGPAPLGPADVNADMAVNGLDIVYLINFIFAGGPPPL